MLVGVAVVVFAIVSQVNAPTAPGSAAGTIDPPQSTSASPSTSARPSASATGTTPQSSPRKSKSQKPTTQKPRTVKPRTEKPRTEKPGTEKATSRKTRTKSRPLLPPSKPVSISIPAIDLTSEVFAIGKAADGTLRAPEPGPDLNKVAWFEDSATPGQLGPVVLEGHVDTVEGRSVFFDLGRVRPGDEVTLKRKDGRTLSYTVDAVRSYPKSRFPTEAVYGGDISQSTLRLITCSDFDRRTRHHQGNLVVFGHLRTTAAGS